MQFPSKTEIKKTFLIFCAIINFWSFISFFYYFPGLIKQFAVTEILSILAYLLAFAFLESLLLLAGLIVISSLIPDDFLKQEMTINGSIFMLIGFFFILPFQTYYPKLAIWDWTSVNITFLSFWVMLYFLTIFLVHLSLKRRKEFTEKIKNLVLKFTTLGVIYFFFDIISLFYISIKLLI